MPIEQIIAKFDGITLAQMDEVKLMNRTDRKYWFDRNMLDLLLEKVSQDYYALEIDGRRNLPYSTMYFDTDLDDMYNSHHRGKMNRYKIRRRNYLTTQSSFLEIKFKSNKGRTVKVRQPSDFYNCGFDALDQSFIRDNTPYSCDNLKMVLENSFLRLMLVSKAMNERCTIDVDIHFEGGGYESSLNSLVVVEVKSDGRGRSAIIEAMSRLRLKPSGFSKYCIGRTLTDNMLRQNRFKPKRRMIDKIVCNSTFANQ